MKITTSTATCNSPSRLIASFDVSKASLSFYSQHEKTDTTLHLEEEVPNATPAIEQFLSQLDTVAGELGLPGLLVVAEATGGYERTLLETARRLGHKTLRVSPEHLSKMGVIESNDTGKTDQKDARVIHLLTRLGKTHAHRELPEIYRRLRRFTAYYDDDEGMLTATRQRILAVTHELFPDYDKTAQFTFGTTGEALMEAYSFDPYAIERAGYTRFKRKMKRRVKYVRFATLEHLFARAKGSARQRKSPEEVELLKERLGALWQDYRRLTRRRAAQRQEIEALAEELKALGELPELDHLSGVTLFNLGRILGETGPLKEFHSARALLRYGGLNLRERKSGTFRGQTRISKKGRPLLRKVLGQATFPLLRKEHLYGEYYHRKTGEEGMLSKKAQVAVMRKFLRMLYSLTKSGEAFDSARFSRCESQFRQAA